MPTNPEFPTGQGPSLQLLLGAAIKHERVRLGVTQEELAWRANMHRTYLSDVERGARNVTLRSVANLARALQMSVEKLLSLCSEDLVTPARRTPKYGEVLLVEDNANDAELAMQAFKRARLTNPVKWLANGRETLDYVFSQGQYRRREPAVPALVLLDLGLPDVSGLEVLRQLKHDDRTRHVPAVVLTGASEDRNIVECAALGADNYLVKPLLFESLSQVTAKLNLEWALLHR